MAERPFVRSAATGIDPYFPVIGEYVAGEPRFAGPVGERTLRAAMDVIERELHVLARIEVRDGALDAELVELRAQLRQELVDIIALDSTPSKELQP